MAFRLIFTAEAARQLAALEADKGLAKRLKAVRKALGLLEQDPNHPGLNTHSWRGDKCPHGGTLFEAYAENNTSGAYRIFFCYVPQERGVILIVAITPHP
jgi:hypothetical protein